VSGSPTIGPAPRRRFLEWIVGVAGAAAAAIASTPVLGAVLFPTLARTVREEEGFLDVAAAADLEGGAPLKAPVLATRYDAWTRVEGVELGAVWLRKKDDGSILAFTSVCPHLGCSVDWLAESKTFNCPCHGSAFTVEGRVASGPAPRPLDVLESRVDAGRVRIKYERFVVGTKDRRNA
jgi:Rieske Fe-S protein